MNVIKNSPVKTRADQFWSFTFYDRTDAIGQAQHV